MNKKDSDDSTFDPARFNYDIKIPAWRIIPETGRDMWFPG
jgi:hypothetical protein